MVFDNLESSPNNLLCPPPYSGELRIHVLRTSVTSMTTPLDHDVPGRNHTCGDLACPRCMDHDAARAAPLYIACVSSKAFGAPLQNPAVANSQQAASWRYQLSTSHC